MSTRRVDDAEPREREVKVEHASLKVLLRVLRENSDAIKRAPGARGWIMTATRPLTFEEHLFALEEAEPEGERLGSIEYALRYAVKALNVRHIILREGEE